MKLKCKKGSALVEAALIFPIVIAGVMAVIYITIAIFSAFTLQSALHMALKKETGKMSKTIIKEDQTRLFSIEDHKHGVSTILCTEAYGEYKTNRLINKSIGRREKGRAYVIDEAEFVRRIQLAKEVFLE